MKKLQLLPTVKEFRAQLKRETAEIALRHIFEQPNYSGCQLQGSKRSTEQKWQPWLNRALASLAPAALSNMGETEYKLTVLGGQTRPPHVLQFSETSGISTAPSAAEPKLQGLSPVNCKRIFMSSSIHGITARRYWRVCIISCIGLILSCKWAGYNTT